MYICLFKEGFILYVVIDVWIKEIKNKIENVFVFYVFLKIYKCWVRMKICLNIVVWVINV